MVGRGVTVAVKVSSAVGVADGVGDEVPVMMALTVADGVADRVPVTIGVGEVVCVAINSRLPATP